MPRATLIVSGLAAAAAAVALLVITLSPGGSEPFRASGPTLPAGVTIPTPNFQFATILAPRNGETQPTEIMIVAERIPYDPAAFHQYIQDSSPEWNWLLKYSEPYGGQYSAITLDHSGAILTQIIYPWHASVFQPFLDYAGVPLVLRETDLPWPTPTPAPTPIVITIADKKVTLARGMIYGEVRGISEGPYATGRTRAWTAITLDSNTEEPGWSSLEIDDAGNVLAGHVRPEDVLAYKPLFEAVALPTASQGGVVVIRGATLTLSPELRLQELPGTALRTWLIVYQPDTEGTFESSMIMDEDGHLMDSSIRPEHEALFGPLLDAAAE